MRAMVYNESRGNAHLTDIRRIGRAIRSLGVLVSVAFLFLVNVTGCAPRGHDDGSSITLAGSTSVQPFIEMLAEEYANTYPDRPAVNVQGGGSTAGAKAASSKTAQIGMLSRNLSSSEGDLSAILVAQDAIAVIVHPSNRVLEMTAAEIADIFSGTITDWGELGGTPGRINPISREEGSGTRGAFGDLIMKGTEVAPRAIVQDSNGSVREIVAQDESSIGYISLGLVDERVKAVVVDGVAATLENCRTGEYGLVRPFLFVYSGEMDMHTRDYVDFVLSIEGQKMLAAEGLVTEVELSSD